MATDEMGRILSLLEEGKINAEEAERLLKAVGTTSNESKPHSTPFIADPLGSDPFRDLSAVLRTIGNKVFGQARKQRRASWRRCGHFSYNSGRAERAKSMSFIERIWWVAYSNGLIARTELTPELRLREDLGIEEYDAENLLDLLDLEFNIDLPEDASASWKVVADVVTSIEAAVVREYGAEEAEVTEEPSDEEPNDDEGTAEAPVGPEDPVAPAPKQGKGAAAAAIP